MGQSFLAVAVRDVLRVDDVAERFGHFFAFVVQDETMNKQLPVVPTEMDMKIR